MKGFVRSIIVPLFRWDEIFMAIVLSAALSPLISFSIPVVNQLSTKMVELVKGIFNVLQWTFVSLYGTKEILFDRVTDIRKKNSFLLKHRLIDQRLNAIFLKKSNLIGKVKYYLTHGVLYIASGIAGSAAAMHKAGWLNAGSFAFPLEVAGNCLFAFASFISLVQNVRIYRAASKITLYAPFHEREAASMLKKSSVLGIISSLNYIIAAALLMFGPAAAFALLFGCIAVSTGCLKILYDFVRFRKAY